MIESIKFPIILIGLSNDLELVTNSRQLTRITNLAYRKKTLEGCTIFDYSGRCLIIDKIEKLRNLNPWWKFEFFNPIVEVKLATNSCTHHTFEKTKEQVISALKSYPEYWDSYDDIQTVISQVSNSSTISDIISYLCKVRGINNVK